MTRSQKAPSQKNDLWPGTDVFPQEQWTRNCSNSSSSSSNFLIEMRSQVAPFLIFRGWMRDWYGHISFTHMGPTVKIPDISLQPITDVQPLTSKVESKSPMEQGGMERHINVLGNQRRIQSPLTPGPLSVRTSWDPLRCPVFQPLNSSDIQFTSNDLKSSLIASSCTIGTEKRRRTQTVPQSHTGWATEGCWYFGNWRAKKKDN